MPMPYQSVIQPDEVFSSASEGQGEGGIVDTQNEGGSGNLDGGDVGTKASPAKMAVSRSQEADE